MTIAANGDANCRLSSQRDDPIKAQVEIPNTGSPNGTFLIPNSNRGIRPRDNRLRIGAATLWLLRVWSVFLGRRQSSLRSDCLVPGFDSSVASRLRRDNWPLH